MSPRLLTALALFSTLSCGRPDAARPTSLTPTSVASSSGMDTPDDAVPPAFEGKFNDGAKSFNEVKDDLMQHYVSADISEDDLYRAAIQGMLQYADPKRKQWNKLMSPSEMAELKSDLDGRVTGVGIKIGQFDPVTGYTTVVGAIPGSAADRAGIAPDDIIVTVDGKLFKGKTIHDIVRSIRGPEGESVTLSILRGDKLISVPLRREMIEYDNVEHRMYAGGIGGVFIRSFTSKTPGQLKAALADLTAQNLRGLVIDLRDNQGGGFEEAVACAKQLVAPLATIVRLRKRDGKGDVYQSNSTGPNVAAGVPLTVVTNHDTSSGAELLSAALREDRQAQIVGTHTYGKWTVQTLETLDNGFAIKFTIGVFQSPSGQSYEGVGLTPDVEVDMDSIVAEKARAEKDPEQQLAKDAQLRTAVNLLAMRTH